MHFGVNHLGHFLLTNLLVDKLKASAPSRIVNVSSLAHERGRMEWDDIMLENSFHPQKAYRQSKLANVLFTRELAKRLKDTGVSTYSLHPGVVLTEIGRDFEHTYTILYKIIYFWLYPLAWMVLKQPVHGAQTSIHCAVDESLQDKSGRYYSDCKEKRLMPHALDEACAVKLWHISEELLKDYLN